MEHIIVEREEFLRRFKRKQYNFIPYGHFNSFALPACLVDDSIEENTVLEITSYVDDIKLTHYLHVQTPSAVSFPDAYELLDD